MFRGRSSQNWNEFAPLFARWIADQIMQRLLTTDNVCLYIFYHCQIPVFCRRFSLKPDLIFGSLENCQSLSLTAKLMSIVKCLELLSVLHHSNCIANDSQPDSSKGSSGMLRELSVLCIFLLLQPLHKTQSRKRTSVAQTCSLTASAAAWKEVAWPVPGVLVVV